MSWNPRKWYQSKTVWVGIITTVVGILSLVSDLLTKATITPQDIVLLVSGALVVILRVWFTDTPISH